MTEVDPTPEVRPTPTPTPIPAAIDPIDPASIPPSSRPQLALHPFSQAAIDEVVANLSTTVDPSHTHLVAAGVDSNGIEVALVLKSVGGVWQFRAAARRDWSGDLGAGARVIASW